MKLFNAVLLAGAAQAGVGSRVIDMVRSNRYTSFLWLISYESYSVSNFVSATKTNKDWPKNGSPGKINSAKFTNPWKKKLKGTIFTTA